MIEPKRPNPTDSEGSWTFTIGLVMGMAAIIIALLIANGIAAPRSAPHAKGWAPPIAGLTGAPNGGAGDTTLTTEAMSPGGSVPNDAPLPAVAVLPAVIPPLAHDRWWRNPVRYSGSDVADRAASGATTFLSGTATWYRWHPGEAAAGPLLRQALGRGWRGQSVTVCAQACVTVRLTDWCSCRRGRRLVDLDSRSFARLAPLSAGVVAVTVGIRQATPTGPPTDVAP